MFINIKNSNVVSDVIDDSSRNDTSRRQNSTLFNMH